MAFLLMSFGLVAATILLVRPAMAGSAPLAFTPINGRDAVLVYVGVVTVAAVLGIAFSLALVAALVVKDVGHTMGYRLAGHHDAQFRLLPRPAGPAISARAPVSDLAGFFVLLMGPGIGLAPMVAAFTLGAALADSAPGVATAARTYALAAGALNFVALLPLWPLPGGYLARMMIEARFPRVGRLSGAAFAAFAIGLAFTWSSALLFLLGLIAALALVFRPATPVRPRLTAAQVRLGFTAYFATLGAYVLAGWWVLKLLPLGL